MNNKQDIHDKLNDNHEYIYSVEYNNVFNMRIILKAHNLDCSIKAAEEQINFAQYLY